MKTIPILYAALFAVLLAANTPAQEKDRDVKVRVERIAAGDGAWLGVTLKSKVKTTIKDGEKTEERTKGAVIESVVDDSPADSAGLEEGDIILKVNGEDIDDASDLVDEIGDMKPGSTATLLVKRDGAEKTIGVVLGEREDGSMAIARKAYAWAPKMTRKLGDMAKEMEFRMPTKPALGIKVQTLEKQLGEYFKAPNGKGVLVTEVMDTKDSPAQQAGMQAGDVIVKLNGESVEDRHDITGALEGLKKGDKVSIDIIRNGARKTLSATLKEDVSDIGDPRMFEWRGKAPMGSLFDGGDEDHDVIVRKFFGPDGDFDMDRDIDIDIDTDEMNDAMQKIRIKVNKLREAMNERGEDIEQLREDLEDHGREIQRKIEKEIEMKVKVKET